MRIRFKIKSNSNPNKAYKVTIEKDGIYHSCNCEFYKKQGFNKNKYCSHINQALTQLKNARKKLK